MTATYVCVYLKLCVRLKNVLRRQLWSVLWHISAVRRSEAEGGYCEEEPLVIHRAVKIRPHPLARRGWIGIFVNVMATAPCEKGRIKVVVFRYFML